MKVSVTSRKKMESRLKEGALSGVAVVSFYDPPTEGRVWESPIDYRGKCDRVIQIPLWDLDPAALSAKGLTVDTYFPEADAVAEFIYRAKEEGLSLLCQCEYGQSRSAGCAAAVLEHFARRGITVFADYRYYPNQLVYHKVKDALDRRRALKGEL